MTIHITDLYFNEEISNALGRQCKFEWVRSPQNHKSKDKALRTSSSTTICSRSPSPRASKHSSLQSSAGSSPRLIKPSFNSTPDAEILSSSACSQCIGDDESIAESTVFRNPRCLKKIGLLYTDAAHSVLNDEDVAKYVTRRSSHFGNRVSTF